ncbi:hypothetical protein O7047_12135 [Pseudenterobacter timonensis]|uniref:Uncharacterized protein n=1 Tax=Pseudenterobacter timonensis TaxID=1755099 RepID=A0AAE4DPY5_9ENTR|nr:hypothetical protein [Pseudenterobacter timonensis]MDR9890973.1 hypothetical protein [Pseudenterobacter timonensis]
MLAELESDRPFSGMVRLTSTELVERFLLWSETHHLSTSPAARALCGKLMQRLEIPSLGRCGRGTGKYYELPESDVLRQRFSMLLGETTETIFCFVK